MSEPNSLMNMSKRDLAAQHERLVLALMRLWGVRHPVSEWRDPLSAVEILYREASEPTAAKELYEALNDLMKCVEAGVLVRDTSRDQETGWALHQLPLLLILKAGMAALDRARAELQPYDATSPER